MNLQNDENSPSLSPSTSESAFIFKTNVIIHRGSAWLYDDFQLLLTFFWIQIYKLEPDTHAFSPGCPVLTRNNSQFRSCFSPFYNNSGEVQDLHFRLLTKFQGKRTMRYANAKYFVSIKEKSKLSPRLITGSNYSFFSLLNTSVDFLLETEARKCSWVTSWIHLNNPF